MRNANFEMRNAKCEIRLSTHCRGQPGHRFLNFEFRISNFAFPLHSHLNVLAETATPTINNPVRMPTSVRCMLHVSPNHIPLISVTA